MSKPFNRRNEPFSVAGHSVPRKDSFAKVSGKATYAIDVSLPRMAHAAVVRSEYPHAVINSIDTKQAEDAPGVLVVATAHDFPKLNLRFGHIIRDHQILALERTLYQGEPVALVVAETRQQAFHAAKLVEVEADELESVTDGRTALSEENSVVLHPDAGDEEPNSSFVEFQGNIPAHVNNICAQMDVSWGDIDEQFSNADVVVESEYDYPMIYGYAMEPYCAVADYHGDRIDVWTTTQHPYSVREDLARVFELPMSDISVQVPYVGGAYGSKAHAKIEPLAVLGSLISGRPVKIVLSIEESILTTRADSANIKAKSAFSSDGTLLARDFDIVLNSGAYTDNSPLVTNKIAHRCFGPYRIPALRVRARSAFTNTVSASSLRGFGAPQGVYAGESQMDEAAEKLGIDPIELRNKNLVGSGDEILPDKRPLETDLKQNMDLLISQLNADNTYDSAAQFRGAEQRLVGTGFALSASDAGSHPSSVAVVRLHIDGSATGMISSTELGQGRTTALAQIIAEELGVPYDFVAIADPDTSTTPYERATGASRTTALVGRALQKACDDVRRRIRSYAKDVFNVSEDDVTDLPAGVSVAGNSYSYGTIIDQWFGAGGEAIGVGEIRQAGDLEQLPPFWEIGTSGVNVEIDSETGQLTISKLATVGDVGFAINPAMTESQDAGAAMMGLGIAMHEELLYSDGHLVNPNVVDYRVPHMSDLPLSTHQVLVERQDGVGPYGSKGAGEGALNPMSAAVTNAVSNAVGRRTYALPLTPERIWRAIHSK